MVQQMNDSKLSEYGLGNAETGLATHNKQQPVAAKKTALRDLQNDNIITVPQSVGNSPISKERGHMVDAIQVSGTKRSTSECPVSPSCHPSSGSSVANGHLVYVRRKVEADLVRSSNCDNTNKSADSSYLKQLGHQVETTQPKPQIKETKISSFPAAAPFPVASFMSFSTGKPTIPLPPGKSISGIAPGETNFLPVTSTISSSDNLKRRMNQHWEDRYLQLQMLLKKVDQSNQEEYLQMLRSLSSVGLSRHAVDLEKRAIQLALEEGKEMERVEFLNVLGKASKYSKAQSIQ